MQQNSGTCSRIKSLSEECNFFQHYFDIGPRLLLDNPHLMADKINEADVIFLHVLPEIIQQLIPLMALLSSKEKESRKFVTLVNHIPEHCAVNPIVLSGMDLCVYDGVIDDGTKQEQCNCPLPPEPMDGDEIDKDFARSSIRHALPRRF